MNKRKLAKFLNKEIIYTATLKVNNKKKYPRSLLVDIKHHGKLYSEHCWISHNISLEKLSVDTKVRFTGTAFMYNDKFNVRKQGLKWCKDFEIMTDEFLGQMKKENIDAHYARKRKGHK